MHRIARCVCAQHARLPTDACELGDAAQRRLWLTHEIGVIDLEDRVCWEDLGPPGDDALVQLMILGAVGKVVRPRHSVVALGEQDRVRREARLECQAKLHHRNGSRVQARKRQQPRLDGLARDVDDARTRQRQRDLAEMPVVLEHLTYPCTRVRFDPAHSPAHPLGVGAAKIRPDRHACRGQPLV